MPRFYFNIRTKGELVEDPEGQDLPNLEAVRENAVISAREIMSHCISKGERGDHGEFEITDSEGTVILTFPFADAIRDEDCL